MATFPLTSTTDTITGSNFDDTMLGTAADLNPTDTLDGSAGYDILSLFGAGTFDLTKLAQFDGFELVKMNGDGYILTLRDGQDLDVDASGATGSGTINLGSGKSTVSLAPGGGKVNFSSGDAIVTGIGKGYPAGASYEFKFSTGTANVHLENVGYNGSSFTFSSGAVTLDIKNLGYGYFSLGAGDATVTLHGELYGTTVVQLSTGAYHFDASDSFSSPVYFYADSNQDFKAGNVLIGNEGNYNSKFDPYHSQLNLSGSKDVFDLSDVTIQQVPILSLSQATVIGDKGLEGFSSITGNGTVFYSGITADLSKTSAGLGIQIVTDNTLGTTFLTKDTQTSLNVKGGVGYDILITDKFSFTIDQRSKLFDDHSIEKIVDASGTYLSPPHISVEEISEDDVVNAAEAQAAGGLIIDGTAWNLQKDAPLELKLNGYSYYTTANDGKWSITVPQSDVAALGSGADYLVAVQASNDSGLGQATRYIAIDTEAPVPVLAINAITADNVVNAAEAGGSVQVSGTVSGEFKAGDTVSLTVNGVVSSGQVEWWGAFSIAVQGSDLAADADHSVAGSITTTDSAGNSGSGTAAKAYSVDTAAPVPVLAIDAITADNVVNAAEAGGSVQVSGTVSGEFKAGDTVSLTVNGVVSTGQVTAGGAFSIAVQGSDLAADADHSVAGSITTTDAAGNSGTGTAAKAFDLAPVLSINVLTTILPEGDGPSTVFRFALALDAASKSAQRVDWHLSGSGPDAVDAADFGGMLPEGTVNFAAGQTTAEVTVLVSGDSAVELDESFTLTLSNESEGISLTAATATATIQNDDLTATDDVYVVLQGKSLNVPASVGLLSNDISALPAHTSLVTEGSHGTLLLGVDGGFSYVPSIAFNGKDDFIYRATDGGGATASAMSSVFVVPVLVGETTTTLNLLKLSAEQQVAATYIAFLGRAADADGFEFWIGEFNDGLQGQNSATLFANIASSFGVSDEAKALYPFLTHPFGATDSEVHAFLDSIYNNMFNRASDAAGLAYWTDQVRQTLQAGQFVGSVLIDIISGAQDTGEGKDITTLMAKVLVGLEYVHEQQEHQTIWAGDSDIVAATSLVRTVTSDPETLLVGLQNAEALIASHP
ncbi:MAG: Ig-like domain-containing protein [Reyranellaceae bacterium]